MSDKIELLIQVTYLEVLQRYPKKKITCSCGELDTIEMLAIKPYFYSPLFDREGLYKLFKLIVDREPTDEEEIEVGKKIKKKALNQKTLKYILEKTTEYKKIFDIDNFKDEYNSDNNSESDDDSEKSIQYNTDDDDFINEMINLPKKKSNRRSIV
jgi:hypothetical protein